MSPFFWFVKWARYWPDFLLTTPSAFRSFRIARGHIAIAGGHVFVDLEVRKGNGGSFTPTCRKAVLEVFCWKRLEGENSQDSLSYCLS